MRGYLDRPGINLEVVRGTWPDGSEPGQQVNLIAWRGRLGPERRGLVLSGHLDVVPAAIDRWSTHPFELVTHNDRHYGRGTTDMKGFVALAMNLLIEADVDPDVPLMVILSAAEEVGAQGADMVAEHWPCDDPPPTACVVGEPTNLGIVDMHKGHLKLAIDVAGRSAHSGTPADGINAIERAADVMSALRRLRDVLRDERGPHAEAFGDVPYPALNIGTIAGGRAINVVPDHCRIELGVRLLPHQDGTAMRERIEAAIAVCPAGDAATITTIGETPALAPTPEARISTLLHERQAQSELRGVSFASDGGVFQRALGMECVLCGPGDMARAHRPDEYITDDELREGKSFLAELWTTWREESA